MASFISKKFFFALIALFSISAQADSQKKSLIPQQLAYENLANQKVEIADYDVARDLPAVKNMVKESWDLVAGGPYDEEMVQRLFVQQVSSNRSGKKTAIKVARVNGQTAGVMTFVPGQYGMVELLAVSSQFRNKGIGYQLLSAAQELAQKNNAQGLELYVYDHNTPAIKLYEKFGLQREGNVYKNISLMSKPFNTNQNQPPFWQFNAETPVIFELI